jgi:hypothetical protein
VTVLQLQRYLVWRELALVLELKRSRSPVWPVLQQSEQFWSALHPLSYHAVLQSEPSIY